MPRTGLLLMIHTYKLFEAFPPKHLTCNSSAQWAIFFSKDLYLQIIESIFSHRKITSNHLLQSENGKNWCTRYAVGILDLVSVDIISTCYVYENRRKLFCTLILENDAGKFRIRFDFFFDDLQVQIIESIFPKASVEN